MKRLVLFVTIVVACAAAAVVTVAGATGQPQTTLDLTGIMTSFRLAVDAKPAGPSAGDLGYVSGKLFKAGKPVRTLHRRLRPAHRRQPAMHLRPRPPRRADHLHRRLRPRHERRQDRPRGDRRWHRRLRRSPRPRRRPRSQRHQTRTQAPPTPIETEQLQTGRGAPLRTALLDRRVRAIVCATVLVRVPETRFALDHAAILYSWMSPPSTSRRRTWSRATSVSDPGGGSSIGGRWWRERWGRCSL